MSKNPILKATSHYAMGLTYGVCYKQLAEDRDGKILIRKNNGALMWYPKSCFEEAKFVTSTHDGDGLTEGEVYLIVDDYTKFRVTDDHGRINWYDADYFDDTFVDHDALGAESLGGGTDGIEAGGLVVCVHDQNVTNTISVGTVYKVLTVDSGGMINIAQDDKGNASNWFSKNRFQIAWGIEAKMRMNSESDEEPIKVDADGELTKDEEPAAKPVRKTRAPKNVYAPDPEELKEQAKLKAGDWVVGFHKKEAVKGFIARIDTSSVIDRAMVYLVAPSPEAWVGSTMNIELNRLMICPDSDMMDSEGAVLNLIDIALDEKDHAEFDRLVERLKFLRKVEEHSQNVVA